jgi:hypothetical protein
MSSGSNFMNPALDELGEGATSITGFGFASHAGFGAGSADASTANSSGEHDTSFTSPPFATRGRVWANADTDKIESAKVASKTRGNSFRNSIDRELPSSE